MCSQFRRQIWLVLAALREQAPEIFEEITWRLLWNSAEEQFSPDFGDLCRRNFDGQTLAALVFEAELAARPEHLADIERVGAAEDANHPL